MSQLNPVTAAPGATSRLRILVADDNVDSASSLALLLRLEGHEVYVAHSGTEAWRVAARVHADVYLLDVGMPGMNGHELVARLREAPWAGRALCVAISGWGSPADKRAAARAGFDHHLTKPAAFGELACLLEEHASAA